MSLWDKTKNLLPSRRRAEEREMRDEFESLAEIAGRRELGNLTLAAENAREVWSFMWLERLVQDIRFALRIMRKAPAFASIAILSVALGIGANTVVFSAVNALLLRSLPVESPDQLVFVNHNGAPGQSFPNYRDIRDRSNVFSSLFMYRVAQMSVETPAGAKVVWGYLVTGNYFEALGIRPAVGRFFGPREDQHVSANPYAVLSYASWQNRFGGDPQIAGKTVRINTHSFTVLGVAPKEFHGTEHFYWPDMWVPLTMQPQIEGTFNPWLEARNSYNGWVAGRLKPGVTPRQADENLKTVAAGLAREHRVNEGMRLSVSPPGFVGSMLRGPVSAFGTGVLLLASLVLLAACTNLASLLSARLADRQREMAIRLSIGAGKGRIIRQLLTESIVLSCIGGAVGIGVAVFLLQLLNQWRAPMDLPIHFDLSPDWRVFAVAAATAVVTGALFGTAPALRAWRSDPNRALKAGSAPAPGRRWAFRDLLLATQVALCCLLVTASVAAMRGLVKAFHAPLGMQPAGVALVSYELSLAGYTEQNGRRFHLRALEEISRIPGVSAVALSSSVPLSLDLSTTGVYPEQTTDFRPKNRISSIYYRVSPGYFRAMGTRLIAGREFTNHDTTNAPHVAIVNQTLAAKLFGEGKHADELVGRRFRYDSKQVVEVIGIAEDGKYETLTEAVKPVVFQPILRVHSTSALLIARTVRPEGEVAADMRRALTSLDPQVPVSNAGSLRQMLGLVYLPANAAVIALGSFGMLAIMLAISGIYGLSAYSVAQRFREIGIRIAIGARPANVVRNVFSRTAILVLSGSIVGLVLGAFGSTVLASIVLGVDPRDPLVFSGAALTMGIIGIAAAASPVRRALRIDPVQALRHE